MNFPVATLAAYFLLSPTASVADDPELKLTAPHFVFLPWADPNGPRPRVTVRFTAELTGDIEDPEKYYCLDEEWEWDDGTNPSRREVDCDPYEPGMEITRRFSGSHEYRYPGNYDIELRLMLGDKTIAYGKTQVQISER
jgi:hypothetical protein